VKLRKNVTIENASDRRLTVVGQFKIKPQIIDGKIYHLYDLKKAVVVE
jgi:hypothetical protein